MNKENIETSELTGSEKQIAWAKNIRDKKIEGLKLISEYNSRYNFSPAIAFLFSIPKSTFWIDNRNCPCWALLCFALRESSSHDWDSKKCGIYTQRVVTSQNGIVTSTNYYDHCITGMKFPKGMFEVQTAKKYGFKMEFNSEDFSTSNLVPVKTEGLKDDPFVKTLESVFPNLPNGILSKRVYFLAAKARKGIIETYPIY